MFDACALKPSQWISGLFFTRLSIRQSSPLRNVQENLGRGIVENLGLKHCAASLQFTLPNSGLSVGKATGA